jgi:hypothetical protein
MNRRNFLRSTVAFSAGAALPIAPGLLAQDTAVAGWRTFEVTTRIELPNSSGAARVWAPAALIVQTPFQRTLSNKFNAEGGAASLIENKPDGLGLVAAEFPSGAKPVLSLTSRVATKDYAVDLSAPG